MKIHKIDSLNHCSSNWNCDLWNFKRRQLLDYGTDAMKIRIRLQNPENLVSLSARSVILAGENLPDTLIRNVFGVPLDSTMYS